MGGENKKYMMRMSLNVLNHLGFNLYSNIPSVLSEVVANSYDADATEVNILIGEGKITISDNGNGMTLEDINNKFLYVGYQKRANDEKLSLKFRRPVMGRKGIGKLSLFSIANHIEIHTIKKNSITGIIEKNGFILDRFEIENQINKSKDNSYNPRDVDASTFDIEQGTRIIITRLKKNVSHTEAYLRKRLARRFSILGQKHNFITNINGQPIGLSDRDYFKKIQFFWQIGDLDDFITTNYAFERTINFNGDIDGTNYKISGWIGAVNKPSDLDEEGNITNNKISIVTRGKVAQEDILASFNESGIFATYLVGEIRADFLDDDEKDDIATSSRQSINEEDERYKVLQQYTYTLLKRIKNAWTDLRKEIGERDAIVKANKLNPVLGEWIENLKTNSAKKHARELFATIENFHFDKEEEIPKKRELYRQGIMAFEKLRLREDLKSLEFIKSPDDVRLVNIFSDLLDIEANLYYEIASERVNVIKKFSNLVDSNAKEKVLQKYLFDNLWLLHPSWERATEGSEIMEKRVQAEFDKQIKTLTEDEKKGRIDIKYRTSAGKHIIIELKRYSPSYKLTPTQIYEQVTKYRSALKKCLATTSDHESPIEVLFIMGEKLNAEKEKQAMELLETPTGKGRILYYDNLIEQSLAAYASYMEKQKEVGKLKSIIDRI